MTLCCDPKKAIAEGRGVPFVGAGGSVSSGLPTGSCDGSLFNTRGDVLIGPTGFEPATCGVTGRRSPGIEKQLGAPLLGEPRPAAPEHVGDLPARGRTPGRIFLEALQDEHLELGIDVDAALAQRQRPLVHDAIERVRKLSGERRLAGETFVENGGERVEVGSAVDRAARDLLGREVRDRSDERVRPGEALTCRVERKAEVGDAHANRPRDVARQKDVLRLDVTVHYAEGVAVVERIGDGGRDLEHLPKPVRALLHELPQRRTAHERHHVVQRAVVLAGVVHHHDRRVVHLRQRARLPPEAIDVLHVEVRGRDQLDRNFTIQHRIVREIDHPHPTTPDLAHELVAVADAGPDHVRWK